MSAGKKADGPSGTRAVKGPTCDSDSSHYSEHNITHFFMNLSLRSPTIVLK